MPSERPRRHAESDPNRAAAMPELDPRENAYRPDLADRRLEGRVEAARFVDGELFHIDAPWVGFHQEPSPLSPRTATKLLGETLRVFEVKGSWAWAQSQDDNYVGYVRAGALSDGGFSERHAKRSDIAISTQPRAPIYIEPSIKARALFWAPMGARLALDATQAPKNGFRALSGAKAGGWIAAKHIRLEDDSPADDWVAAAEKMLNAPYLWGGDTMEGLDCSGLIAVARRSVGLSAPRDSDLQARAIGVPVPEGAALQRGDLVFWKGHVGVMRDRETLLHANSHAMAVTFEKLDDAMARIATNEYGTVTARRRTLP